GLMLSWARRLPEREFECFLLGTAMATVSHHEKFGKVDAARLPTQALPGRRQTEHHNTAGRGRQLHPRCKSRAIAVACAAPRSRWSNWLVGWRRDAYLRRKP